MPIRAAAMWVQYLLQWLFLIPVVCGSTYALLTLFTTVRFRLLSLHRSQKSIPEWPAVTILKPVHGLEKHQADNLRSACLQDYPDYQVVFSVQELDDQAIPLLKEIQKEFGSDLVTIAVENCRGGSNGKINNMMGGLRHARHAVLVISDSDVRLTPDYLKIIVAPLSDPEVGCACTLYKAACADRWFEKMELLTLNADFVPNVIFAYITGASKFCLGASAALRRSTLEEIGGLEALADYLVEDYEMGRRIWVSGKKVAVVPYLIDTVVDLKSAKQWWDHQVYWDQNTRAARPMAYFVATIVRSVPFALLYAAVRGFDIAGLTVLGGAVGLRLLTSAIILGWGLRDREGLRSLMMLPFRDISALASWFLCFTQRTTIWRGTRFILTRDGRLIDREAHS